MLTVYLIIIIIEIIVEKDRLNLGVKYEYLFDRSERRALKV